MKHLLLLLAVTLALAVAWSAPPSTPAGAVKDQDMVEIEKLKKQIKILEDQLKAAQVEAAKERARAVAAEQAAKAQA
jgi:molybdopterin/thiamine biosynthesis adenylyltransferase